MKPSKKIYKADALKLLNLKAVPIKSMQDYNMDEKALPIEVEALKRDEKELALLAHQANNRPTDVNSFLLQKYTDGSNFARAEKDKYDNSDERKNAGISFTYHVFYPEDAASKLERASNRYIITDKIIDTATGDEYFYHFPIRKVAFLGMPYFITDFFGELINTDGTTVGIPIGYPGYGNPLFSSLQTLAVQLRVGKATLSASVYKNLMENGFMIKGGKLTLDVRTGVLVEKYFLSFNSIEKKPFGIQYLEKELKYGEVEVLKQSVPRRLPVAKRPGSKVEPEPEPETEAAKTIPVEDEAEAEEKIPDIPEQTAGLVTVWSTAGLDFKEVENLPLPTLGDSIEDVVKKLRDRGVSVTFLKSSSKTKAPLFNTDWPIPLCYGKSNVLLVQIRPLVLGFNSTQYQNQATALWRLWIKSITPQSMSSYIPSGMMRGVIERDFGKGILDTPSKVTETFITGVTKYHEKYKKA